MFTVEDFLSQFEKYSDEELINVQSRPDDYSPEAVRAAEMLIDKKGGLNVVMELISQRRTTDAEITRVRAEAKLLASKGVDPAFIKESATASNILSSGEVANVLETALSEYQAEVEDKKIKPHTVYGSLFGCILASFIGSALWGGQLVLA